MKADRLGFEGSVDSGEGNTGGQSLGFDACGNDVRGGDRGRLEWWLL